MRISLAFIITIISISGSIAQTFSPGYIIDLKHDTIHGFVADRIDRELVTQIEFSKEKNGSGLTPYTPLDLLGFGFDNGRVFERFSKPGNPTSPGDSISFFAKKNISGKIKLYTVDTKNNQPDMVLVNVDIHRKVNLTVPQKKTMTVEKDEQKIFLVNEYLGLLAYVKNEPTMTSPRINYSEKSIKKNIMNYNNRFTQDFPVTVYDPRINYSYDISFGLPVARGSDSEFRMAVYRIQNSPETSRTYSTWIGVSYRYWSTDKPPANIKDTNQDYRQQFISVIPLGFNFHSSKGFLRPYFYFGIGLTCLL
ncbi:MAG TPA: hypothetical protein PLR06_13925, partial [Cyclobacteriaceae bacterium]|nr:hypothetical protein [Cyclobacteriaceae bacterium]